MWFVCDGDLLFFLFPSLSSSLCVFLSRLMWRILSARLHSVIASASAHTHTHTVYKLIASYPLAVRHHTATGPFSIFFHPQEGRKKTDLLARPCRCVFSAAVQGKAFSQSSTISLFVVTFTGNLNTIQLNFVFGAKFNWFNFFFLNSTHLLRFSFNTICFCIK